MKKITLHSMKKIVLLLMLFGSAAIVNATKIYVKADATGAANGSSWTDAYTTISAANTAANNGDTIYVAAGTYTEASSVITITKVFTIKGGYIGNEDVTTATPDPLTNQSVIRCTASNPHGLTLNAATTGIPGKHVFDGLYFYNTSAGATAFGGGLYITGFANDIDIKNCVFDANKAGKGGAMYIQAADATSTETRNITIDNCKFIDNGSAGTTNLTNKGGGGAIWCGGVETRTVQLNISNSQFIGNYTYPEGGAIYMREYANLTTDNVLFRGNQALNSSGTNGLGGAIYFYRKNIVSLTNSFIISNYSGNKGNLFFNVSTAGSNNITASLSNIVMSGNHTGATQSNIHVNNYDATTITFSNTIIANNTQTGTGTLNEDFNNGTATTNLNNNYTLTNTILAGLKTANSTVGNIMSSFTNTDYFTQAKVKISSGTTVLDSVVLFVNTTESVNIPQYAKLSPAVEMRIKSGGNNYTLLATNGTSATVEIVINDAGTYDLSVPSGYELVDNSQNTVTSLSTIGTHTLTLRRIPVAVSTNTNISAISSIAGANINVQAGATLTVDQNSALNSLTVAPGAKVTVNSGYSLTAANGITLQSDADSTATLLDENLTPTITATVQQYVTAGRNWYISAPVSAADYTWLNRGTSVQEWDEATKAWVTKSSGTLVPGKGYIQVATSTPSVTGSTGTVDVNGTTNSGDVAITVSRTESGSSRGFNLVGNPYPSYLKWTGVNSFLSDATNDSISTSFWFRTKNTADTYVFTTYNGTSHTVVGGTNVSGVLNEYIPPMQAFWIRVNENAAKTTHSVNLTFKNNMRAHGAGDNNKFRAPQRYERSSLRLTLSNGSQSDESLIYFDAAASNEFDNYDSPKMLNNSSVLPDIYSMAGTERLAINGLNKLTDYMELPLGFTLKSAITGLKLKLSELSNFEGGTQVYLLDKEKNTQTQLLPESEYSFDINTATTNNESRFALLFRAPGVATSIYNAENAKINVFVNATNHIVINAPAKSDYAIYNAMGQLMENGKLNTESETRITKLAAGVYVVKVGNLTNRIIVK